MKIADPSTILGLFNKTLWIPKLRILTENFRTKCDNSVIYVIYLVVNYKEKSS